MDVPSTLFLLGFPATKIPMLGRTKAKEFIKVMVKVNSSRIMLSSVKHKYNVM